MATPALPSPATEPTGPGPLPPDGLQLEKLALIGQMASSVAHELSNPLATIVASTQAILAFWPQQREGFTPPPDFTAQGVPLRQLRDDLELILAEARRAGEIIHGLLTSARPSSPEWLICSVADVVRRTVGLCRHHLKLHNITLQAPWFDPQEGYPLWSRIRGDANQLQQVLLNLVINAQQAITAGRGYGTVRITLAPDGPDRIVLTVEDDGPGVPESLREAIFRPFYTTKPSGQGTGLGLSISAGIVQSHGGELRAEGHPDGGAVFRLVLPSLAATDRRTPPHPAADPAPAPATAPEPIRVLLVDDEHGIRRSVGRFLGRYGFRVTDVGSADAAVTALRSGRFDAVVTDLRMPGLTGEQFYQIVEREFPAMSRRMIFTSGDLSRAETREFIARTGCASLQKPYELSELVRLLRDLGPEPSAASERRATA